MRRPPLPFQAGVGDDREPSGPTSCRLTSLPPGSRWTCRVSASISDTVSPLSRLGPPRVTAFSSESHPSEWSAPEATPPPSLCAAQVPNSSSRPQRLQGSLSRLLRCAPLSLWRTLPLSSMASLLCCGPKLAACGIVLSAWGVIMLVRGLTRENRSGSEGFWG